MNVEPQFVLQVSPAVERALEEGLRVFELTTPRLEALELRVTADGALVALLSFENADVSQRPRAEALAARLDGLFLPATQLPSSLRRAAVRARAASVDEAFGQLRASPLRLPFVSQEALLEGWARHVGQGAIFVPDAVAGALPSPCVTLATPTADYADNLFRVITRTPIPGQPGRWLEITAGAALQALLRRADHERRQGQRQPPPAGAERANERFVTDLCVHIDQLPDLAEQWASDISRGGLFVCTDDAPPLGSQVRVRLTLPSNEVVHFDAEVVHRVLSGPRVGVGLRFIDPSPHALASIEGLLTQYRARRPRVLVVDDEPIWRSTLARLLKALDVEVVLACDGREGLLKLIDGYFELDLVILDLHMPHIDGRTLIDRVRRLGKDSALKLFLFSATSREELASLGAPGLATAVFSKLDPVDKLAERLALELSRTWPPAA